MPEDIDLRMVMPDPFDDIADDLLLEEFLQAGPVRIEDLS